MSHNIKTRLFLSHSKKDKDFVKKLALTLSLSGFTVWYDDWEIKVGDSIVEKVDHGITTADFLVIVLSNNSVNSKWVREELNAATMKSIEKRGVFILPVLLEKCAIPSLLADKSYADFSKDFNSGFLKLTQAIDFHFAGSSCSLAGRWVGDTGYLDVQQEQTAIYGQYTYYSQHYCGELHGVLIGNILMKFRWMWPLTPNPVKKGSGYLIVNESRTALSGGWWYSAIDKYIDTSKMLQIADVHRFSLLDLRSFNETLVLDTLPDNKTKRLAVKQWSFRREGL